MGHSILQTILLLLYGGQYDLLLLPDPLLFTPLWLVLMRPLSQYISVGAHVQFVNQ